MHRLLQSSIHLRGISKSGTTQKNATVVLRLLTHACQLNLNGKNQKYIETRVN